MSIQYVKEGELSEFEPLAGSFISALGTGEHVVAQQFELLASSAQPHVRLGKFAFQAYMDGVKLVLRLVGPFLRCSDVALVSIKQRQGHRDTHQSQRAVIFI